jgi:MinD-like ATPase involved in chromosome partitioning or flagellar assembly
MAAFLIVDRIPSSINNFAHKVLSVYYDDITIIAIRLSERIAHKDNLSDWTVAGKPMAKIIVMHSFKGGTGRSNVTICMAALLAQSGMRVGVIDSDTTSSCIQILVGKDILKVEKVLHSLAGPLPIRQVAHNLTSYLGPTIKGQLFVIPKERIFADPYTTEVDVVYEHFQRAIESLNLEIVFVDAPSGLSQESLLATAMADSLIILMRPDRQDYQGTSIMVDIARWLDVPRVLMMVNEVPSAFDLDKVKAQVEQTYQCEVGAVLPHSEQLMALGSSAVFSMRHPEHPITHTLQQVAASMLPPES